LPKSQEPNSNRKPRGGLNGDVSALIQFGKVIDPSSNYLGLPYSQYLTSWSSWLLSAQPDFYTGNHVMYLRKSIGSNKEIHTRIANQAEYIEVGTAILIPVHVAQYHIGSYYQGMVIEDEIGARRALRNEVRRCKNMWATISAQESPNSHEYTSMPIVPDLTRYYCESPLFELTVSDLNPFKDQFPLPMKSQSYTTVVGGYFILLVTTDIRNIYIYFGSSGNAWDGSDVSEAYYQIIVVEAKPKSPEDLSKTHFKRPEL
jgi:hypothetical protein